MALAIDPVVLGGIVVGGVSGVVALTWLVGWGAGVEIDDAAHALQRFLDDFPAARPADTAVADDRRAALLWFGDAAPVGAVFAFGDKLVTRKLAPGLLDRVEARDDRLRVRLVDFGAPSFDVILTDPAERARWAARLGA